MMKKIPVWLWALGGALFVVGDTWGANTKQRGDTFSEMFRRLPAVIKYLFFFFFGAVFSHLAEWTIGPSVNVEGDLNVEVNKDGI